MYNSTDSNISNKTFIDILIYYSQKSHRGTWYIAVKVFALKIRLGSKYYYWNLGQMVY